MNSLYNKAYLKKAEKIVVYNSPEEALADLLEGVRKHMAKALSRHRAGEIEERLKSSENAIFIILSILGALDKGTQEDQQKSVALKDFLHAIKDLIYRFNITGQEKYALIVLEETSIAAYNWKKRCKPKDDQAERFIA